MTKEHKKLNDMKHELDNLNKRLNLVLQEPSKQGEKIKEARDTKKS
jgi:hypothetical protein